jgi:glycosyltransferase involved in cell wall biosynthesis
MRLTLIISSLGCGGAERVMSTMANYWAAKAWKVTLLTVDDGSTSPFYDLDPRINHIPLAIAGDSHNAIAGLLNNLNRIRVLRLAVRDSGPQAVISFMDKTNILSLLATQGLDIPVIVSERIDPTMNSIGMIWEQLRRLVYPLADILVVQSKEALDYFPPQLRPGARIIPNPVLTPPRNQSPPGKLLNKPLLVAVGRLDRQKGFDFLLHSFAQLKDRYREWTLIILGEGPLRAELELLRNKLGLADRVLLAGRVKNTYQVLRQADIFVMSSRFEGFPNALCEAMACGLPVICTDCRSGPREIITDGVDGLLVPNEDVNALAAAMDQLMGSDAERKRLALSAIEVTRRFALEKVMRVWEETLDSITLQVPAKYKTKTTNKNGGEVIHANHAISDSSSMMPPLREMGRRGD